MTQVSLLELSNCIGQALEEILEGSYWVSAEIASMSERGGHLYLDLVEKGKRETIIAKLRATCWSGRQQMLQAYFEQETGSRLQAGMQVLLEVEVNYHSVYGVSLNIVGIDPSYTLGDMARQRQKTIQQLHEEGVFDMQRSLVLPTLTMRLAVISSATAAGYGDFCAQLAASGYRFEPTLFGAIMQGDNAEQSILNALEKIAEHESEYDAVVLIRGGGATTDLSCFDRYLLCAACAQYPLPILSGIGHTRDVSIVDMVAFAALNTPTAVAEFLIDRLDKQVDRLNDLAYRLQHAHLQQALLRQHRLDSIAQRLLQTQQLFVAAQQNRLQILQQRLLSCSPERIFKMGYSMTKANGKVVRSAVDVAEGDVLTTYLLDGAIESTVK